MAMSKRWRRWTEANVSYQRLAPPSGTPELLGNRLYKKQRAQNRSYTDPLLFCAVRDMHEKAISNRIHEDEIARDQTGPEVIGHCRLEYVISQTSVYV